jgi:integrase
MAMAKFRIPGYCIHTAKQQAYVRLNGEMLYLGTPGSPDSHAKYDRLIAEWMSSGRTFVKPAEREGISVNEVLLAYRRFAEGYYVNPDGTNTPELEKVNLSIRPVMDLYGETPAQRFGPKALKALRDKLVGEKLCRITINQRIGCIKRAFGWAVEEELIPPSILHGLKAVKGLRRGKSGAKEGEPVKPVPQHIIDVVMKHLPPTLQAMVKLHDLTGMRSGEMVIMRACDIEMPGDGKPWLYRPLKHKTMNHGHQRVVSIGPKAQQILLPFLQPDVQAYIFTPTQAQAERNIEKRKHRRSDVQPSQVCRKKARPQRQPGERYTTASYRRALTYATTLAVNAGELPEGTNWHPHQLRHNCATRIRKQHGLDAVRAALGHRTVTQSAEYAELDTELAVTVAAAVG